MKQTTVSNLKAKLSAFLADVRRGETVIVCDRKTPIAQLTPVKSNPNGLQVEEASADLGELAKIRPVRLRRRVDLLAMLREDRNQR